MNYKKIKPKKLYEEVAEALHEMIRTGQLKPGDQLDSVQQLAENFQVGRSAIREALTYLRAMGLVEMRQGEGTFVSTFDTGQVNFPLPSAILMNKDDVIHLLEVRKINEIGIAALAAKKRTGEQLQRMKDALEEMKQAKGDEELGEKADLQFHLAIAEATGNPLLLNLMNQVSGLMGETMKETRKVWIYSKQTTLERLYEEHAAIYEAIEQQDEDKARQFMRIHLENVEGILKRYYQQGFSI